MIHQSHVTLKYVYFTHMTHMKINILNFKSNVNIIIYLNEVIDYLKTERLKIHWQSFLILTFKYF